MRRHQRAGSGSSGSTAGRDDVIRAESAFRYITQKRRGRVKPFSLFYWDKKEAGLCKSKISVSSKKVFPFFNCDYNSVPVYEPVNDLSVCFTPLLFPAPACEHLSEGI